MKCDEHWDEHHALCQFTNAYKSAKVELDARGWSVTCDPEDVVELQAQRAVRDGDISGLVSTKFNSM